MPGPGTKKKWLAIARDDQLKGSHIFIVEANTRKSAYDACLHQCVINHLTIPEQRAVYELKEDGGAHICTVLDAQPKGGLFNGRAALSLGPETNNTRSGAGAV